jgi:hypothetical protein
MDVLRCRDYEWKSSLSSDSVRVGPNKIGTREGKRRLSPRAFARIARVGGELGEIERRRQVVEGRGGLGTYERFEIRPDCIPDPSGARGVGMDGIV